MPEDTAQFEKDFVALHDAIQLATPAAVRAAIRHNWRKCITGSVHDESFFVRAVFKHCTDHIYKRSLEEYADKFLQVASPEFLDRAMEIRLATINAKDLVAILAKAKRLGYDEMDVVDENEDVMPAEEESDSEVEEIPPPVSSPPVVHDQLLQTQQMNAAAAAASSSNQPSLPTRRKPNGGSSGGKVCPDCGSSITQAAGLKYVRNPTFVVTYYWS